MLLQEPAYTVAIVSSNELIVTDCLMKPLMYTSTSGFSFDYVICVLTTVIF